MQKSGIGTGSTKPSKHQLCKYAILMCLSGSHSLDFEQLGQHTGFEDKTIVRILGKLMQWQEVKKEDGENGNKMYVITKAGTNKLNYFKRNGYNQYWQPA